MQIQKGEFVRVDFYNGEHSFHRVKSVSKRHKKFRLVWPKYDFNIETGFIMMDGKQMPGYGVSRIPSDQEIGTLRYLLAKYPHIIWVDSDLKNFRQG